MNIHSNSTRSYFSPQNSTSQSSSYSIHVLWSPRRSERSCEYNPNRREFFYELLFPMYSVSQLFCESCFERLLWKKEQVHHAKLCAFQKKFHGFGCNRKKKFITLKWHVWRDARDVCCCCCRVTKCIWTKINYRRTFECNWLHLVVNLKSISLLYHSSDKC